MILKKKRKRRRLKSGGLVKILSIDGGGIRGLIPSMVMTEIERLSGKPISSLFNLVAGTSTGGIIALAIAKPDTKGEPAYSAEKLKDFYQKNGKKIFSRSIFHKIQALGNLTDEKYPATGLEEILEEYFGETLLSETLTDVLITAYEIERRTPFFFSSHTAKRKKEADLNLPMKVVARGTSAAPIYFEPLKIETDAGAGYYAVVDGGVVANNPAMCAVTEVMKNYPGINLSDILLVSLGTGRITRRLPFEEVQKWGLRGWARPLLSCVYDGVSQTVDHQLKNILAKENYYRFQVRLEEANDEMDNTKPENIRDLELLAEDLIIKNHDVLKELCKRLKE